MQNTQYILMIRPVHFGYNAETAVNNTFQVETNDEGVQEKALQEFDALSLLLKKNGVDITVVNDTPDPHTPDSIFPNNWISFHEDGKVIFYPMYAENRRRERKPGVLNAITGKFTIKEETDLTRFEKDNFFLEGTGSMVLDRENKIAYACLSPRTDKKILNIFCEITAYEPVIFNAVDSFGNKIYHTNVMMCVGDTFVVICLDSIHNPDERSTVESAIKNSGKDIIPISMDQMNHFAGNMLQLQNNQQEKILVMSSQAYQSLSPQQVSLLEKKGRIIHSPIDTIEKNGGGSARCMIAEIFLPIK